MEAIVTFFKKNLISGIDSSVISNSNNGATSHNVEILG